MNANDLTTIDQLSAFLAGTQRGVFEMAGDIPSTLTRPTVNSFSSFANNNTCTKLDCTAFQC